jgi:hypothetical protein
MHSFFFKTFGIFLTPIFCKRNTGLEHNLLVITLDLIVNMQVVARFEVGSSDGCRGLGISSGEAVICFVYEHVRLFFMAVDYK